MNSSFKKGDPLLVLWAASWESATYQRQGIQEGTIVVKLEGDPFDTVVKLSDVRAVKEGHD